MKTKFVIIIYRCVFTFISNMKINFESRIIHIRKTELYLNQVYACESIHIKM